LALHVPIPAPFSLVLVAGLTLASVVEVCTSEPAANECVPSQQRRCVLWTCRPLSGTQSPTQIQALDECHERPPPYRTRDVESRGRLRLSPSASSINGKDVQEETHYLPD
jgi:hypothetical protein